MDARRVLTDEEALLGETSPRARAVFPDWAVSVLPAILLILFFLILREATGGAGPDISVFLEQEPPSESLNIDAPAPELLPFAPPERTTPSEPKRSGAQAPPEMALWPFADRGLRFQDPLDAATSFAEVFVGFANPVVGQYRQIDRDYGQVEIRATADGAVTLVQVHRLAADQTWWVMGASASNIDLDNPGFGKRIDDPIVLSGTALAVSGEVHVELRAAYALAPVLQVDFVTDGGLEPDWFEGAFGLTHPGEAFGALVVVTRDQERGEVLEAAVIPVLFTEAAQGEPDV